MDFSPSQDHREALLPPLLLIEHEEASIITLTYRDSGEKKIKLFGLGNGR